MEGRSQSMAFTFELSDRFLSETEREVFGDHLKFYGLDDSIWEVFAALFRSGIKHTRPLLLRVFRDNGLFGAIILTKCSRYGRALFDNKILSGFINIIGIPYFQWIKFGCCMDMMSNPGFVRVPEYSDAVFREALQYLKGQGILTIITDYSEKSSLYEGASILPALPHALIDCSGMASIGDYLKNYKNVKRKLRVFETKGGNYIRIDRNLNENQLHSLKRCFISTAGKSLFYLPYQELYLKSAITTSSTKIRNAVYFIATINGEFIGYQAAIKTGKFLNALHGAFDRDRKSTHHAYDILFVRMTEYAIAHGLEICDFGAVLNFTKQKMVNVTIDMSYFVISRYSFIQKLFSFFLRATKIHGKKQLRFRSIENQS